MKAKENLKGLFLILSGLYIISYSSEKRKEMKGSEEIIHNNLIDQKLNSTSHDTCRIQPYSFEYLRGLGKGSEGIEINGDSLKHASCLPDSVFSNLPKFFMNYKVPNKYGVDLFFVKVEYYDFTKGLFVSYKNGKQVDYKIFLLNYKKGYSQELFGDVIFSNGINEVFQVDYYVPVFTDGLVPPSQKKVVKTVKFSMSEVGKLITL